jgi:plastocyanin
MSEVLMLFRLALVSAVLTLAIACGGSDSTPAPSPTPAPGGPAVTIPRGAETLGNQAYSPDAITVTAGATVTWTNTDAIAHTSTSDANGWNSGNIAPGGQFSVAFPTAGTFPYHCTIHPGMVGSVVVH